VSIEQVLAWSVAAIVCGLVALVLLLYRANRHARDLKQAVQAAGTARDRANLLLSVAEAVNSSVALEDVLNLALTHSGRLVGAAAGGIYLARGPRAEMIREAAYGLGPNAPGAHHRFGGDATAIQADPPSPTLITSEAPELADGRFPTHLLVLPLQRAGHLVGTMEFYLVDPPPIGSEEIELLTAVAATAASAIHHAQLYRTQEQTSLTDELTRLPNRRYLAGRLTQEMQRARRHGQPMAFMMVDLDHFKKVNDTHGHLVGDAVLAELAQVLQRSLRESDVCARYGGEEFGCILHSTGPEGAHTLAERLRASIERASFPAGLRLTASIGVAATGLPDELPLLVDQADRALYEAKHTGRNRVMVAALGTGKGSPLVASQPWPGTSASTAAPL
jgi:diguanylate cyclase (GGDEF)-like protein